MANDKTLFEVIENERKAVKKYKPELLEMPEFTSKNLKYDFFEWQKSALENFLIFDRTSELDDFPDLKNKPTHLLFNMATGSGKTMMMAALILYYFEKGYRHFLFFVNQNNIVDKTENNFIDPTHAKFLFTEKILQGDTVIPIRKVEMFSPHSDGIEIKFTSIQKLYNDIHTERENQTTLADLHKLNLVMLGDEAHHLNAQTKKGNTSDLDLEKEINDRTSHAEIERKGWEHMVLELLLNKNGNSSQSKNVLLEFTATLPENAEVQQKYADKIITKFGLKEFLQKGYTKEINLVSSTLGKKERVLHALLFAWYRHQIALKYGIANFKPVMLFRSKTIDESKNDYFTFLDWVKNIHISDFSFLNTFSDSLNDDNSANEQGKTRTEQALKFMQEHNYEFGHLANWIRQNYQPHNVIITNSETNKTKKEKTDSETEKLLNSLEDSSNPIRAIFTVDRLTEGWDVLNLFDIVRLYEGQNAGGTSRKLPKATVAEKQLIGRGVRYFPFALPFIGTREFTPRKLWEIFGTPKQKLVKQDNLKPNIANQNDWYVLDNFAGTSLEEELVGFIKEHMGNLQKNYDVKLLRNEEVLKLSNFDNGEGFMPDFILLMKAKQQSEVSGINDLLQYQIFIEPKGRHLVETDRWKEEFLSAITKEYGGDKILHKDTPHYRLIGLPFFREETGGSNSLFEVEFIKVL